MDCILEFHLQMVNHGRFWLSIIVVGIQVPDIPHLVEKHPVLKLSASSLEGTSIIISYS